MHVVHEKLTILTYGHRIQFTADYDASGANNVPQRLPYWIPSWKSQLVFYKDVFMPPFIAPWDIASGRANYMRHRYFYIAQCNFLLRILCYRLCVWYIRRHSRRNMLGGRRNNLRQVLQHHRIRYNIPLSLEHVCYFNHLMM